MSESSQSAWPSSGDGKPAADDGSGAAEPAAGFRIGGEEADRPDPADEQGQASPPRGTPAPTDAGPAD